MKALWKETPKFKKENREELFRKDSFPQAMAVYMHELLHEFGADASMQFRIAILAMNYRIMECSEKLESYEK